ncbi:MAG TPA: thiamine phosphate synthase, partial [Polyangiaceae bacterium]|nr:thiamine phosphate synthase [Polyangiaceae bacterium]
DEWLARLTPLLALARPASVLVMLRDRQLPARERRAMGAALRVLCSAHAQLLCVNDRLDLALLLDADAVHLPEDGVAVEDARALGARHGRSWWVSRASHEPADTARTDADAVLLAPVAEARKGRPALGVEGLARARAALDARARPPACRLYALGGVTAANAPALLEAGAHGVALIGALLEPGAPAALVRALALFP